MHGQHCLNEQEPRGGDRGFGAGSKDRSGSRKGIYEETLRVPGESREEGREGVDGAIEQAGLGDWRALREEGSRAEKVTLRVWLESLGADGAIH